MNLKHIFLSFILFCGVFLVSCTPQVDESTLSTWTKGAEDTSIVVVEFSDLQCPACKAYAPFVKEIVDELGDRMKFEYRHFPLAQHTNARKAAYAAEAAGMQGKFFEMHDKLFETQNIWSAESNPDSLFEGYANDIGLDVEKFKTDRNSPEAKAAVERDVKLGRALNVNSTPTFFLNGTKLQPKSPTEFQNLVRKTVTTE